MKPLFADTSYLVALCGPKDQFHARAIEISASLLAGIVTTEYVLVETGGLLLRPIDRPAFVNLVRDLETDPTVQIVPLPSRFSDPALTSLQSDRTRIGLWSIASRSL